jgi:hypothetical protein
MLFQHMAALIPLFKEKQLKPSWNYDAGTLIWRIYITSNNFIVGETRNQETKSTSYFCIDSSSGNPLWQNMSFEEPWWIGIEAVHEQWMILHGFVRPDMPGHRGIRIIDLESGKLLWRNDDLTFWFIDDQKLYAHKYLFEKHIACVLDIHTGAIIHERSDNLDLIRELRQKVLRKESERQQDVLFPHFYDEKEATGVLRKYIQRIKERNAVEGWIEFLSLRDILILSQYRQMKDRSESPTLDNILSVFDLKNEKILFTEIIAERVTTPSPGTFFVKDDVLFFIKHQTMLIALQPWK